MGEIISIYNQKKIFSGIYKLNFPNGKCYIGQSINIVKRIRDHNCCKKDYPVYRAIRKYGVFKEFELLEEISPENFQLMNERERYYIQLYNSLITDNGYNITTGGEGNTHDVSAPKILSIKEDLINNKMSIQEIADKYNYHVCSISLINQGKTYFDPKLDYPLKKHDVYKSQVLQQNEIEEIHILLKEHNLNFSEIAQLYNISETTIRRINNGQSPYFFDDIEYPIRKKNENLKKFDNSQVSIIIDLLKNSSLSQIEIAKQMGCERQLIGKINSGKKYFQPNEKYPIRMTNRREQINKNSNFMGENGALQVLLIDPDGNEYFYKSLAELERKAGLNKNTAKRSLELEVIIKQGKYKGWQVKPFIENKGG